MRERAPVEETESAYACPSCLCTEGKQNASSQRLRFVLSLVISAGATQHALSDGMYVPVRSADLSIGPVFIWVLPPVTQTGSIASDDLAGAFLGDTRALSK